MRDREHWTLSDRVCHRCIGDEVLKAEARAEGVAGKCVVCDKTRRRTITLEALADRVDSVYREIVTDVRDHWPSGEAGHYPEEIIRWMIDDQDDSGLPEALTRVLSDAERWDVVKDGADEMYDASNRYEISDYFTAPYELSSEWREFEARLKHGRRFFDPAADGFLRRLLDVIGAAGGPTKPHIVALAPGSRVYRSRGAESEEQVTKIITSPAEELGPPPRPLRRAGRMNAHGIATFYGAFSVETCIAEVRPSVGGFVVCGTFEVTRALRLLDLTFFRSYRPTGSIFDSAHRERLTFLRFLSTFHDIISRPVIPSQEPLEYVPTQAVADFLASAGELDGVIYSSAQVGSFDEEHREGDDGDRRNIAIFNADGIVELPVHGRDTTAAEDSWMLDPFASNFSERAPEPALRYVEHSETTVRITAVRVEWEFHAPLLPARGNDANPDF